MKGGKVMGFRGRSSFSNTCCYLIKGLSIIFVFFELYGFPLFELVSVPYKLKNIPIPLLYKYS